MVTRGGQHTGADTRVDPIQFAVAALPVVANQEYLHLDCRSVDLDPAYSPVEAASVLAAELRRPTTTCVSPTAETPASSPTTRRCRPSQPRPPYAPVERTSSAAALEKSASSSLSIWPPAAPARSSSSAAPASQRTRAILERSRSTARAQGVQVHTPQLDITDETAVRDLFASHRVDGVVHAAAEMAPDSFRALRDLDQPVIARHFGAKVTGAQVLARVLADLDPAPEWCLLFSSTSAILGGVTFGGYAAANAALDAIAANQSAHPTR